MSKQSPVVHFEMGYHDADRMCTFYEKIFGWQTQPLGKEMGGYVLAQTTETDQASGRPTAPGTINGGFYQKVENPLSHPPSVVIAVDDIRQTMNEIEAGGGKILGAMGDDGAPSMEPMQIPNVGLWISAMDTEGNRISLLQPTTS